QRAQPDLGDAVQPPTAHALVGDHPGTHQIQLLELLQLGVHLAHRRTPVEEADAPVGPLLQIVAGQLLAEGEHAQHGPAGRGQAAIGIVVCGVHVGSLQGGRTPTAAASPGHRESTLPGAGAASTFDSWTSPPCTSSTESCSGPARRGRSSTPISPATRSAPATEGSNWNASW